MSGPTLWSMEWNIVTLQLDEKQCVAHSRRFPQSRGTIISCGNSFVSIIASVTSSWGFFMGQKTSTGTGQQRTHSSEQHGCSPLLADALDRQPSPSCSPQQTIYIVCHTPEGQPLASCPFRSFRCGKGSPPAAHTAAQNLQAILLSLLLICRQKSCL